jgi:hypothetical protein
MHPHVQREITNARVADLHREAEQARLARAVRLAHRERRRDSPPRLPRLGALAQHLLCLPRRWQPSRRSASCAERTAAVTRGGCASQGRG